MSSATKAEKTLAKGHNDLANIYTVEEKKSQDTLYQEGNHTPRLMGDLISILDVNEEENNFYLISSSDSVNGSFIINSVMTRKLKCPKYGVLLIGLGNTLDHYHNIGQKLGYDFKECINRGQAIFDSCSSNIMQLLLDPNLRKGHNEALQRVLELISSEIIWNIEKLCEKYEHTYVCLDNLTYLLQLGVTVKDLVGLLKPIIKPTMKNQSMTIIVNTNVLSKFTKDDTFLLSSYLRSLCDCFIEVTPFETGNNKSVSGCIIISYPGNLKQLCIAEDSYKFKLFERGVKMFSSQTDPTMSSTVLNKTKQSV